MIGSADDAATVTVAADGTATATFNGPPPGEVWITTVYTSGSSTSGVARVLASGKFRGSITGVAEAWGGAMRLDGPGVITVNYSGCIVGDSLVTSLSSVVYSGEDVTDAPFPTFISETSVDLFAQAQWGNATITTGAGGATVTIVTPAAGQQVRAIAAVVSVTADVTTAGAVDTQITLFDVTAGTNNIGIIRFFAPAAAPASATGATPSGLISLGGGVLFPQGHAVGFHVGTNLTGGSALCLLGYVLEGA